MVFQRLASCRGTSAADRCDCENARVTTVDAFLEAVEQSRTATAEGLKPLRRSRLGQFFTPRPTAALLASMVPPPSGPWRLLDPGAGNGSLTAAVIARWLTEGDAEEMEVVAYEIDEALVPVLRETLDVAKSLARHLGRRLSVDIRQADFVVDPPTPESANLVVMNPPYRKLGVRSPERRALEDGSDPIRVTNMYAAFLVRAVRALAGGGSLVAITPRSFANGPYFRGLREELLRRASFECLHVFDARDSVFSDADVLQENLVFSMRAGGAPGVVKVSSSRDAHSPPNVTLRAHDEVIHPDDPERFVRLPLTSAAADVAETVLRLPATLEDLGLQVSTGKVVDFRSREHLRDQPATNTAPLVYPQNLVANAVCWPVLGRKPQALAISSETRRLFLPNEHFVLVKRFTAKEEPRRVVAAVSSPSAYGDAQVVAFENHLNVFHASGGGLDPDLALGLATFLNSDLVDTYVRQFSGHTQVNATDLRRLRYPDVETLRAMARGGNHGHVEAATHAKAGAEVA